MKYGKRLLLKFHSINDLCVTHEHITLYKRKKTNNNSFLLISDSYREISNVLEELKWLLN